MAAGKIAVVIPTYNESENIGALLDRLDEVLSPHSDRTHFLVVDDMSIDGTADIVLERQRRNPRIHLLSGRRAGLGAAYVRGLSHALDRFSPDVVIHMDADFSHSPRDIPRLLDAVAAGADLAIGSRYAGANRMSDNRCWKRRWLSHAGSLIARHWLGLRPVMDCTAGFRAWRADTLRDIDLGTILAHGYVINVAMLHRAFERGARVTEVPVVFRDRTRGMSKLGWTDMVEFARWTFASTPLFWRKR